MIDLYVNGVMTSMIDSRTTNNFKYYYIITLIMGFDFMCGFGDTIKGGGKSFGEALSKVASVFFDK